MKKSLLLLAAGSIAFTGIAQERHMSQINDGYLYSAGEESAASVHSMRSVIKSDLDQNSDLQHKTTAAPRWYSYADYFDQHETDLASSVSSSLPYLWKDTMGVFEYGGTSGVSFSHNRMVSVGMVVDPAFPGFNNFYYFPGDMKVTATDAFAVDSIRFFGAYGHKDANTYIDTLRVSFVYGDGSSSADILKLSTTSSTLLTRFGVTSGSLDFTQMLFDPGTVTADGTTVITKDIILDNTGATKAWNDTTSNGLYYGRVGLGTPGTGISIPAGNLIGASISFFSGSPTFTAHDTVFAPSLDGYRHNAFRPVVYFKGTSTSTSFPTYDPTDMNNGQFKTLPDTALGWGGTYVPLWYWSSNGGASGATSQYPVIDFHVICATCGVVEDVTPPPGSVGQVGIITSVNAFPNPANNQLNIPFSLGGSTDVTVTLTNMIGQVVATQSMTNVSEGTAVFNTVSLPQGVYTYTLNASGGRTTGSVVIAH